MNKFWIIVLVLSLLGGTLFFWQKNMYLQTNVFTFNPIKNNDSFEKRTLDDYLRIRRLDTQQIESTLEIEALWEEFVLRSSDDENDLGYMSRQTESLKLLEETMESVFKNMKKLNEQTNKNNELSRSICQKQDSATSCD